MTRIRLITLIASMSSLLLYTATTARADGASWNLNTSIERVMTVAPELKAASADIAMRRGALSAAGAFPNPSIELRADQKLGIDDGSGGTDLTQVSISQPLPLGRLNRQKTMAAANLSAAEETRRQQRLQLEHRTAMAYHKLQLAQARLDLAKKRLAVADTYTQRGTKSHDGIVRYISKSERLRLDILRESARQAVVIAEGEFNEAVSNFRSRLSLPVDAAPIVPKLGPVMLPPTITALLAHMDIHPTLAASQYQIEAAHAGIEVARSQRLADPVLSLFVERDYLGGSRRNYAGVMLSVQVPLWSSNKGSVSRARAEANKAEAQYLMQERDLSNKLRLQQMHLGHLIEQAADYKIKLVGPTGNALTLTRKSFNAGQVDLLTLIDAYNTYFDARFRYLELLQLGWMEAADLRLTAGLSLGEYAEMAAQAVIPEGTKK